MGRFWLGSCRNGQHRARHRDAPWGEDAEYLSLLLAAGGPDPDGDAPGPPDEDRPDSDEDGSK